MRVRKLQDVQGSSGNFAAERARRLFFLSILGIIYESIGKIYIIIYEIIRIIYIMIYENRKIVDIILKGSSCYDHRIRIAGNQGVAASKPLVAQSSGDQIAHKTPQACRLSRGNENDST
jgi:hypothetical protein